MHPTTEKEIPDPEGIYPGDLKYEWRLRHKGAKNAVAGKRSRGLGESSANFNSEPTKSCRVERVSSQERESTVLKSLAGSEPVCDASDAVISDTDTSQFFTCAPKITDQELLDTMRSLFKAREDPRSTIPRNECVTGEQVVSESQKSEALRKKREDFEKEIAKEFEEFKGKIMKKWDENFPDAAASD